MANDGQFLSAKAKIDTGDFKNGIAIINQQVRLMEAEFKANAAAMDDWTATSEGLESRMTSLSGQIGFQQEKVRALKLALESARAEQGENSTEAVKAQEAYLRGVEALGKMQTELRKTEGALKDMAAGEDKAADGAKEVGKESQQAEPKVNSFRDALGKLGGVAQGAGKLMLGLGTAAAGVAAAGVNLAVNTAETADNLVDMSTKTGVSVERLQELQYAGELAGFSVETLTDSQYKLVRSMDSALEQSTAFGDSQREQAAAIVEARGAYDAAVGSFGKNSKRAKDAQAELQTEMQKMSELVQGEMAQAFDTLGVSFTNTDGSLRSADDVMGEVLDKLGSVSNETERDALAMQLFGKSAQDLVPIIKLGKDGLAELSEQAHEAGAVMSDETVGAAAEFNDQLSSLKLGLQGVGGNLAATFLPGLSGFASQAQGYISQLSGVVAASGGDVGAAASGIGEVLGTVISDVAAQAPQMLTAGLGIIQGLVNAIISQLPTLIPAVISIIMSLADFIIQNIPLLLNAAIQILLGLVNGLTAALPTLIPAVVNVLITIVQTLIENIPILIEAAVQLLLGLAEGLIAAIPILLPAIPQILTAILDAIIASLPIILNAAGQLIGMLATGIVENFPILFQAMVDLLLSLGTGLAKYIDNFDEMGAALVMGVWQGVQENSKWFFDQITKFFLGIVDKVKDALGIHSPSSLFADEIGEPSGEGAVLGLKRSLKAGARVLQNEFTALANFNGAGNAPGVATATGRTINQTIYATKVDEYALERYLARAEAIA